MWKFLNRSYEQIYIIYYNILLTHRHLNICMYLDILIITIINPLIIIYRIKKNQ